MQEKHTKVVPDLALLAAMIVAGALILLAGMELYVKVLLLFVGFSAGYLYQVWIRKSQSPLLLQSKHEEHRIVLLVQKASEMNQVSFRQDRTEEDARLIFSFLNDVMSAEKFVIWVRGQNEFKVWLSHKTSGSFWNGFRRNNRFVSRIRSLKGPHRIETLIGEKATDKKVLRPSKRLRHLLEKTDSNWVLPLGYKSGFLGFVLLNSPRTAISPAENALVEIVCERLREGIKRQRLKEEADKIQFQLISRLTEERQGPDHLTQIQKKRLFDLHSLFQSTETIYNVKDKERLFFTFTNIVQKQMDSRWVVIVLPGEKSKDLIPKCSRGIDLASFRGATIKKESRFFSWVSQYADPFLIYDLNKSLRREKIVTLLLGLGVQMACKLTLPGGDFGIVLLGEKSEGIRYDSTDSDNLGILANMARVTLKNIKEFKIVEELSYTDSMTGLYNYRYFYKRLSEESYRAKRFGRKLSLVIFDIDDFKVYNDTFGHQAGDAVLRQLGKFLLKVVRSIDVVSRYGGEEFCVIMPEADDGECRRFMERLRKSIKDYPFKDEYLEHEHHITVSLGGAVYPQDAGEVDRLIYCADMALLQAKGEGRNRSVMFQSEKAVLRPAP